MPAPSPLEASGGLSAAVDSAVVRGAGTGALQPLQADSEAVDDAALPYVVHWASTLAPKRDSERLQRSGQRPADPFLPYDPDLFVAELSDTHVMLLNKFPLVARHTLIVTRSFAEQTARLDAADFEALARAMAELDGLAFYNGGATAGASQRHKHLQLVPDAPVPLRAVLARGRPDGAGRVAEFAFRHVRIGLRRERFADPAAGAALLAEAYEAACAACGLRCEGGLMPPYNLLVTRDWLLLVPRSREHWRQGEVEISLNALCFSGSVFVRRRAWVAPVRAAGLAALLAAVTVADGDSRA